MKSFCFFLLFLFCWGALNNPNVDESGHLNGLKDEDLKKKT